MARGEVDEVGEKLVDKIKSFIEEATHKGIHYKQVVEERTMLSKDHIVVDYKDLVNYDPELVDSLLDAPDDFFKTFEQIVLDSYSDKKLKRFALRVPLPDSHGVMIRELRSKHLNKFILIKGVVKNKGVVQPKITSSRYECPDCGKILNLLQSHQLKQPKMCTCGRRGSFKLLSNEMYDGFTISLEENPEDMIGEVDTMLKSVNVFFKEDLAKRQIEKMIFLGARVAISGTLKEMPRTKEDERDNVIKFFFDANFVKIDEEFSDLKISEAEGKQIEELANRCDILDYLSDELYKGVCGYDFEKKAIILSLIGGSHGEYKNVKVRPDIHILFIGDPATSKSQFLKITQTFVPRGRYCAGKGSSTAGLTAAVIKDELVGGFSLQAGELPLANKGVLFIDEFDKLEKPDQGALHEGMEQQSISISKAGIHARLSTETTIIAAANPKWSRFTGFENFYKEFDLMPTLLDRFDFIFPMIDRPDEVRDRAIAKVMLRRHKKNNDEGDVVDKVLFKKYVILAKRFNPTVSDEASDEMEEFYVTIRNKKRQEEFKGVSARLLNSMTRAAQAYAKLKLCNEVTKEHVDVVKGLMLYWIRKAGYDAETPGVYDIDTVQVGMSHSTRSQLENVMRVINALIDRVGNRVPLLDVVDELGKIGISAFKAEEIINRLKNEGSLYEPNPGFIGRV